MKTTGGYFVKRPERKKWAPAFAVAAGPVTTRRSWLKARVPADEKLGLVSITFFGTPTTSHEGSFNGHTLSVRLDLPTCQSWPPKTTGDSLDVVDRVHLIERSKRGRRGNQVGVCVVVFQLDGGDVHDEVPSIDGHQANDGNVFSPIVRRDAASLAGLMDRRRGPVGQRRRGIIRVPWVSKVGGKTNHPVPLFPVVVRGHRQSTGRCMGDELFDRYRVHHVSSARDGRTR